MIDFLIYIQSEDNWPFKLEIMNIKWAYCKFYDLFIKFRILEILNFHQWNQ